MNQSSFPRQPCSCGKCGGLGWIPVEHEVDIYPEKRILTFMKPCPSCRGRMQADNIGLPLDYCNASLSQFQFDVYGKDMKRFEKIVRLFTHEFDEWEKSGKGLYIWSRMPGTGKSFLCSCIANGIAVKGRSVRFITLIDYLNLIKKSFKTAPGDINRERDFEKYLECDLLVVDDLAAEKFTDWVDQEIFRLVNDRMSKGRVTVYTSNVAPEKLPYNERTKNRIINSTVVLNLPEVDIRGRMARERQEKFLEKILG